jgi:signal transduction histidine kinase
VSDPDVLPRFLLKLPLFSRLSVAFGSVLCSLIVFMYVPLMTRNPIIFIIPMTLVAWLFRRKGVFLSIFCSSIVVWIYYGSLQKKVFLPFFPTVLYFIICIFSLLIMGLFISSQRHTFDLSDRMRQQLFIAYEQQQNLNQVKDQFLQNINHELRTPLTAIYGYLELLLVHNEQLNSELRITFLEHAMQSCDELQLLINNVLDSMGMNNEKQRVRIEELAVIDIVMEVLERFDPKTLQEHLINIDIPHYIVVRANAQYTRQVLRNLLSNAFKYAPVDTPITISAKLYGHKVQQTHPAPEICIVVKDVGPGIPDDEKPLLFGQFVRLQRDTSGRVRGSGLGLYLSKQFVEMMAGKIWVESEGIPGKGSSFCFTLPCVLRPGVRAKNQGYTPLFVYASIDTQKS